MNVPFIILVSREHVPAEVSMPAKRALERYCLALERLAFRVQVLNGHKLDKATLLMLDAAATKATREAIDSREPGTPYDPRGLLMSEEHDS